MSTQLVLTPTGRRYHYPELHLSVEQGNGTTHAYTGPSSVGEGMRRVTLIGPRTLCGLWIRGNIMLTNFEEWTVEGMSLKPCKRCESARGTA